MGLSVCGGIDTNAAFRGLIRIKRLFPNQSAWCTGMLQPGDILLEANGTRLTGLTNYVNNSFFLIFFIAISSITQSKVLCCSELLILEK